MTEVTNKLLYIHMIECYDTENEQTAYNNVDGSQKCNVDWNKSNRRVHTVWFHLQNQAKLNDTLFSTYRYRKIIRRSKIIIYAKF